MLIKKILQITGTISLPTYLNILEEYYMNSIKRKLGCKIGPNHVEICSGGPDNPNLVNLQILFLQRKLITFEQHLRNLEPKGILSLTTQGFWNQRRGPLPLPMEMDYNLPPSH